MGCYVTCCTPALSHSHPLSVGEEEEADEDDQVSNNELMRSAAVNAQFSQLTFGELM